MHRLARRLAAVLMPLLLLAPAVRAEEKGSLAGSVRTREGAPLPHVVLLVTGPSGSRTVVTGPEGRYRASALAPATSSSTRWA